MTSCARSAWLDLYGDGTSTLPLEDPNHTYYCSNLDLGSPLTGREVVNNNPDRDGVTDRTQYLGSRVVTANITAAIGAGGGIDNAATLFAPYMLPSARPVLHYILDRPTHPERTLTLRPSGYSWPIAGPASRNVQLQWVAADPVCYAPSPSTATATPSTNGVITNSGDVPARPLFRVYGPITGPSVLVAPFSPNPWLMTFLSSYVVGAGHHIDIDSDARTVLFDSNPAAPRLAQLDWTVSSWQWVPAGSWTLGLNGAGTTTATQVVATWQNGYLS